MMHTESSAEAMTVAFSSITWHLMVVVPTSRATTQPLICEEEDIKILKKKRDFSYTVKL